MNNKIQIEWNEVKQNKKLLKMNGTNERMKIIHIMYCSSIFPPTHILITRKILFSTSLIEMNRKKNKQKQQQQKYEWNRRKKKYLRENINFNISTANKFKEEKKIYTHTHKRQQQQPLNVKRKT